VCSIDNNTAICDRLNKTELIFRQLAKKGAFFHWYTNEGMDEQEFHDSKEILIHVIKSYETLKTTQKKGAAAAVDVGLLNADVETILN